MGRLNVTTQKQKSWSKAPAFERIVCIFVEYRIQRKKPPNPCKLRDFGGLTILSDEK